MKIVSMKQLRQNFDPIRKGLARGDTYLLMYRSRPLGVMRPYSAQTDAQFLEAGEEAPALSAPTPPAALPDPKTISFGSTFNSGKMGAPTPTPLARTSTPPAVTVTPTNPLHKLGMRKAFL